MLGLNKATRIAAALVLGIGSFVHGQIPSGDTADREVLKTAAVEYLFPQQITVAAGNASDVTLHFRVADGLHINSHTPKDEYLIPTTFSIPDGTGVRLEQASYPAGEEFTLSLDPNTKLSVYTREFTIQARIVASPGNHLVEGKLHYQACSGNACLPPKTIPVAIDVIGK